MGIDIAKIKYESMSGLHYSLENTTIALDEAYTQMSAVKDLIIKVAEAESKAQSLDIAIKKTQKRANALEHILIPRYEASIKFIQSALEERERDGLARLKSIKGGLNE